MRVKGLVMRSSRIMGSALKPMISVLRRDRREDRNRRGQRDGQITIQIRAKK